MNINIQQLHKNAKVPTYANPGDACFDLHAATVATIGYQSRHSAIRNASTHSHGWARTINAAKVANTRKSETVKVINNQIGALIDG